MASRSLAARAFTIEENISKTRMQDVFNMVILIF
jgi:hypothetical protein